MLQVVEKISYLLEGDWMASDRTPECLQIRQFMRNRNTIRSRESLQQTQQIHNMISVLTSFFHQPASPMLLLQTVGRTVRKDVVIH